RTVAATAPSVWGPQHPSYEYNLAGTGELILTRLVAGRSGLVLPNSTANTTYFLQSPSGELVAEIVPPPTQRVRVALPVGQYRVVSLEEGNAYVADVHVVSARDAVIERSQFREISPEEALSKGGPGRRNDIFLEGALAGLGPGIFSGSAEVAVGWLRRGLHWSYGVRSAYGRAVNTVSTIDYRLDRGRLTADLVRRVSLGSAELHLGGGLGAALIHETLQQRTSRLFSDQYATAPTIVLSVAIEFLARPWLPVRLGWGATVDFVEVDGSRRAMRELRGAASMGLRF
ncbi:MAG TPA: hypothetical protein VGF45_02280, partial [Polyangia bacterium]